MELGVSGGAHGAHGVSTQRTIGRDVADMLADARHARGWSLREAGRRLGVTAGTIVHREKARRAPSIIVAEDIIDAYDAGRERRDAPVSRGQRRGQVVPRPVI